MSLFQYVKDTRGELRHVAWPTRTQTVIYTVIVIAISLFVAAYLGFFDYIFTTGLGRALLLLPQDTLPQGAEQLISGSTSAESIIFTTEPQSE